MHASYINGLLTDYFFKITNQHNFENKSIHKNVTSCANCPAHPAVFKAKTQTISNMITKLAPRSAVTIFQPTRIHSVERGICPIAASYVML